MSPIIAEIVGTAILILLGNGVVANVLLKETKGNNGGMDCHHPGFRSQAYACRFADFK